MTFDYNKIDSLIESKNDEALKDYMIHLNLDWKLIKPKDIYDLVAHAMKKKMEVG